MTPQDDPLKLALAIVIGSVPGLLAYPRVLKVEALGRARRLVAAVVIGVITAAAFTITSLLLRATDGFPGADEHPVGVAAFLGCCFGICAVLFRDGAKLTFRKRDPGP